MRFLKVKRLVRTILLYRQKITDGKMVQETYIIIKKCVHATCMYRPDIPNGKVVKERMQINLSVIILCV